MANVTIISNINIPANLKRIDNPQLWKFAANEWHRLYYPWIPYRTGTLANNVQMRPKEIEHTAPYAKRMYFGSGMNFQKDQHPNASAGWDKAAEPTQKIKLVEAMQEYVNSGALNLRGR